MSYLDGYLPLIYREKGKGLTIKNQQKPAVSNRIVPGSQILLFSGVFILILALVYMILNLESADAIVHIWIPFMVAGILIVYWSQILLRLYSNKTRDRSGNGYFKI